MDVLRNEICIFKRPNEYSRKLYMTEIKYY